LKILKLKKALKGFIFRNRLNYLKELNRSIHRLKLKIKICQISKQYAIGFISLKKTKKINKTRHSGRPITAATEDYLKKIQAFTMSDPYCTYDEIEASSRD